MLRERSGVLEEALDKNSSHLAARENLAGVLAGVGRFRESLEHFREAIRQAPSDAETRLLMARVHLELGEREPALAQIRRALELDPGSAPRPES